MKTKDFDDILKQWLTEQARLKDEYEARIRRINRDENLMYVMVGVVAVAALSSPLLLYFF